MPNPLARISALAFALLVILAACSPAASAPSRPAEQAASPAAPAAATPGPDQPAVAPASQGVSFAKDILPIFEASCIKCHGGDKTEKGLDVKTYDALMAGSQKGSVVVPGDPDRSKLAQLILNGKMPKRGPKLSPEQVQLVLDWIKAGAQNN